MIDFSQIYHWIDAHQDEIVNFCCEGIAKPSVTGSELLFQQWFQRQCIVAGFDKVDVWAVDKAKIRPNVVSVLKGSGGGRDLILNGHCDVVPVSPQDLRFWETDPWQGSIREGKIYGRGAVDMKGGLTAMYFAALALKENGITLKGDLIMESVVGEELCEHLLGTTAAIERGYVAPFGIVLEPTSCELHTKSPGAATWELKVKGKTVHHAKINKIKYPQAFGVAVGSDIGVDAFQKALKILAAFDDLQEQWNFRWRDRILGGGGYQGRDQAGVGIFYISPGVIHAGDYIVSVPGFAEIQGSFSYAPWVTFETVEAELRAAINSVISRDDWLKLNPPSFQIFYDWPGYITEPEHPACQMLAKAYEEVAGKPALFTGFTAVDDASFLHQKGIPAITFGPGSIDNNVHGNNEFIEIDSLSLSIKVLVNMIVHWCGIQE